jgi:uncharacterized metal-binding protein YceD (DUF177 family)
MKIRIHGIKDGKHIISLKDSVENFPYIFPEFIGEVELNGILTKIRNRFSFSGKAKCDAKMICDFCLEEYVETINADVEVNFIVDTNMYFIQKDFDGEPTEIAIHEDDTHYDITNDIKDMLVLNLPMKRLSLNCKGKTFNEIYNMNNKKDKNKKDKPIDVRWAKLKDIKFD